jgi:hypothetical protein
VSHPSVPEVRDFSAVLDRSWGRSWEFIGHRKSLVEVARDLCKGPELSCGHRLQHHRITVALDEDLGSLDAERLRESNREAPSVAKQLCRRHIYTLYLWIVWVKRVIPCDGVMDLLPAGLPEALPFPRAVFVSSVIPGIP